MTLLEIGITFGLAVVAAFYGIGWLQAGRPPFIAWITDTLPRD